MHEPYGSFEELRISRRAIDGVSPILAGMQGRSESGPINGPGTWARGSGPKQDGCASATRCRRRPLRHGDRLPCANRARALHPHDSAAAFGVAVLPLHEDEIENGSHRAQVLAEAFDVAVRIVESPSDAAELDRAALVLAHCEQVYRRGAAALKRSLGEALDLADNGLSFAMAIDEPSLTDLRALMEANAGQLDDWQGRGAAGERYEPNPVFAGSNLVGGADADWLVGDTLIYSKAYGKLTVPTLRRFLRQLLGYVMLDLDDALGIRSVGLGFRASA